MGHSLSVVNWDTVHAYTVKNLVLEFWAGSRDVLSRAGTFTRRRWGRRNARRGHKSVSAVLCPFGFFCVQEDADFVCINVEVSFGGLVCCGREAWLFPIVLS